MKGTTDGGRHIEGMRTSRMKSGHCQLRATGCQGYCKVLERHHEKYRPESVIYVCHHCHHLLHFRPYHLTGQQKEKLLQVRHGPVLWASYSRRPRVKEKLLRAYIAPGRRKPQLEVRREVRGLESARARMPGRVKDRPDDVKVGKLRPRDLR
jgi:hypothetical protein